MPKQTFIEGQTATNPQTGQKIVYSKGRWSPVGAGGAKATSPQAVNLFNQLSSEYQKTDGMARMGNEFMGYNQTRGTGGIVTMLPSWGQPNKQAMEGVTSAMVAKSIVPGQARSMDSNKEMEMALRRFPNVNSQGPVNRTRNINLQMDRYLAAQKLAVAKQYVESGGDPATFELEWTKRLPQVRAGFKYEPPARLDAGKGQVGAVGGRITAKPTGSTAGVRHLSDDDILSGLGLK